MAEVHGDSATGDAVLGVSSADGHAGVAGVNDEGNGPGVFGRSERHDGVQGFSKDFNRSGVVGTNTVGVGVLGQSTNNDGVRGVTQDFNRSGVVGTNAAGGVGVLGQSVGNGPAGRFIGRVEVTDDIQLTNQDCAEDFDMSEAEQIEPGAVTVLNQEGDLQQSQEPYDKCVAGIVSGAGGYRPGITLGKQESQDNRIPVALLGKVYCKVDAEYSPIEVGDLLTTSSTPGHAMKAADPVKAFGAVLGKALRPLKEGQGLIPVLVALQ